jgi:hypothetical protein
MRAGNKLPAEVAWSAHAVTYFDDKHQTLFKDYVRKLFARSKCSSE